MADPIKEDDPTDFILIELIGGKPVLMIDLGSGIGKFEIPGSNQLNDGEWHRLDIFRNGQVIPKFHVAFFRKLKSVDDLCMFIGQ